MKWLLLRHFRYVRAISTLLLPHDNRGAGWPAGRWGSPWHVKYCWSAAFVSLTSNIHHLIKNLMDRVNFVILMVSSQTSGKGEGVCPVGALWHMVCLGAGYVVMGAMILPTGYWPCAAGPRELLLWVLVLHSGSEGLNWMTREQSTLVKELSWKLLRWQER